MTNTTTPNTMQAAIGQAIQQTIKNVQAYIRLGWSVDAALQQVKDNSTLGVKSWAMVVQAVK